VLCFCFVFLLLVYPMLPVSLDCPFVIAPLVFSNVYCISSTFYQKKQIGVEKRSIISDLRGPYFRSQNCSYVTVMYTYSLYMFSNRFIEHFFTNDYWLMYNDQFFSYMQDENKFTYIQKPHGNEESDGSTETKHIDLGIDDTFFFFFVAPIVFLNLKI